MQPTKPENLTHAIARMTDQGFSHDQIAGQIQKWHPGWNQARIQKLLPMQGSTISPVVKSTGPPIPALQQHGYHGSITDFNARVQAVHDSYQSAYGTAPSPNLTLDLAKSPVQVQDFVKMFQVPISKFAARSRGALTSQGIVAPTLHLSAKDVSKGILDAAKQGDYQKFIDQHVDQIHSLAKDPQGAAQIAGAVFKARRIEAFSDTKPTLSQQNLQAMGLSPTESQLAHFSTDAASIFGRGVAQVTDSLVHAPAGIYELGKAIGLDTRDYVHDPANPHQFNRSHAIAKGMVKATVQDVEHPGQNPGYLFLDALGFASPIASGAARVGEAGRLAKAGELGDATKALVKKPPLRRVTLTHGDLTAEMPLSQNPLVAAAQEFVVKRRQAGADKRLAGDAPAGIRSLLRNTAAGEFFDKNLSFETKIGRELDARKRTDHIVNTYLSRELDHVAGRAITQARIHSAVPSKVRGALTRGEQKAIQVQSWDIEGDAFAKVQAERDFHNRMIDAGIGIEKAHKTQLADLKLAENALKNPSPRFLKALALTRRVVDEMQAMKIKDLGLSVETAEGRIAKSGQTLRGEERVGGKPVSDESFYLPEQPRGKVKSRPSDRAGFYSPKSGTFGEPPGRDLPELKHENKGHAIIAGDYRIDATSLATEAYGRTVRAVTVREAHAKHWDAASAKRYGRFSVPVRDVNEIPDELRPIMNRIDEGDFTTKDAEGLPADMQELIRELYPDPAKLTDDEIEHVRWLDARLLGESQPFHMTPSGPRPSPPHVPGGAAKISQAVQGPFRVGVLYLRPAYILNKLGNHAMGVLDQGWMWPVNYVKALSMDDRYGADATRTIHELVGAGKSQSYVASTSGKVSQGLADFWNRVADRGERAASFIYWAERKGYKGHEGMNSLLFDQKNHADLSEVKRRANKALVEFDNLTPIEKNYLRHFIFVYPWVSRSAVWSLRTIMDHPSQIDLMSHLGREDSESDPIFKNAPAWFKRTGYIPVGWNSDGTPKVVNPTSVNSFSTLGDFMSFAKASTTGDKYASAEDFLGPMPKYLVHAVSGRDEFGNKYPGSQWWDAAKQVLIQLPQVSAYQKAGKVKKGTGRLPNVGDRSSLETSLNANLHATVMSPGWLGGYGSLLAGGLSPRDVNTNALEARYWADQSPEKRHARELDLLNRALDIQAGVLKEEVPKSVRAAVKTGAEIDFQYKNFLKETGRAPTDKERAQFTIDYLAKQGSLKNAAKWKADLAPLADTADINRLKNTLLDKYANGKALRQWDTDIRTIASFTPEVMNQKAAELHRQGLSDQSKFSASQEKLYDYGRKYVAFTREVRKMQDNGATPDELRAFQDAHDKSVDGLPSFVRIAWANQTPQEQAHAITSAAATAWRDNSAFEKALLGRPSDAKVTAGWAKLREIVDTQRAALKREGRSFPGGYERTLAKYVEKYYDAPGLVKDYDFAAQPLVDRLKYLRPIQKSPNKGQWNQLLGLAHTYAKWLDAKNADGSRTYSALQVRQSWEDYISTPPFQAWLKKNPAFHAELENYGKTFLTSLVG